MMTRNCVVGISGGIGSGKSVVSRILRCNDYKVFDCDYEAKIIMNEEDNVVKEIKDLFGEDSFDKDGCLNKKFISEKIFIDGKLRGALNNIVHSRVKDHLETFILQNPDICFVESAILFSSGVSNYCTIVWEVEADIETRISRVLKRNNLSEEEIKKRMESQNMENEIPTSLKKIKIDNNGKKPLIPCINKELKKLTETYA